MAGIAFEQLRTATNPGLEDDGTGSLRIKAAFGVELGSTGLKLDPDVNAFKEPCRVKTTANIATLAGGAPDTVDGVSLAVGNRILIGDQSTTSQDGIYEVQTLGTGANGTWIRTADAPSGAEAAGWYIQVLEGTVGKDLLFRVDADLGGATVGTDGWTLVEVGGATSTTLAGAGLVPNGAALDVNAGTGIEINADTVRLAAQGNGIAGGAGSTLSVNPDSTGGNTLPVSVSADGVGVDISAIAGTGIEADGSANLRLAAQGNGIAGGAGSTLSVQTNDTGVATLEVDGSGIRIAATAAGTGLTGGGASALAINQSAGTLTYSGTHVSTHTPDTLQVSGTPNTDNDAVNKAYVDSVAAGLDPKESCQLSSTQILDAEASISGSPTFDPDGGTGTRGQITATLGVSGVFNLDGTAVTTGSRVLIKNESSGVAEAYSITAVADSSGSLNNTYFIIYTLFNIGYYIWFNVAAGGSDPAPTVTDKKLYGIEVALATNDTAITVADAVRTALSTALMTSPRGGKPATDAPGAALITFTNQQGGDVPIISAGTSGFTSPTVTTPGTGMSGSANGIWDVTIAGTSLTMNRASDFDGTPAAEVSGGAFTFIEQGTTQADSGWVQTYDGVIPTGGDDGEATAWAQFSGAGQVIAGNGLTKSGNTIDLGENGIGTFSGLIIGTNSVGVKLAPSGGLKFSSNEIAVEPADFAGTGLEDGGSDTLRLSLQGDGIAGGNGSILSVQADPGGVATIEVGAGGVRIAASAAGAGLAGGGGSALSVNTSGGVTLSGDNVVADLEAAANDAGGLILDANQIRINVDSTGGANLATVVKLNANGVAISVDDATLEDDGNGATAQLRIKALGVDTGELAANAVTIAKLGVQFNEEAWAAGSFTSADPSVSPALSSTALVDSNGYGFVELYRNGVADMTKNSTGTAMAGTGSDQWKIQSDGSNVEIGANINGSGNTYRLRYLSAL